MSTVASPPGKLNVEINEVMAAIFHPRPHRHVPNFYGYARYSLDKPYPVEDQEEELQRLWKATAEGEGVKWAGVFRDPATHSNVPLGRRKAGGALLERLRAGDHIAMTKLDRAFCNLREAVKQIDYWVSHGIVVHVLDLALNITTESKVMSLAQAAQLENSVMRERTKGIMNSVEMKAKMASRRTRGKAVGRAPHGFRYKGATGRKVLVEDPEERAIMAAIVTWRDRKNLSWQHIAALLLRERIQQSILARILRRNGRSWGQYSCRDAYFAELKLRSQTNAQTTAPSLAPSDGSSPTEASQTEPST
jgi:DNA invertase Pin-like site-specific DNA recombinase